MISKTGAKRMTSRMREVVYFMQNGVRVEYSHVFENYRINSKYISHKTVQNLLQQGYITGDTPDKEIVFALTDRGKAVKI